MRDAIDKKPYFLVGSPTCTAFRALQALNKSSMDPAKWDARCETGIRHLRCEIKIYRLQVGQGRWLLHEHPSSASSRKLPAIQTLICGLSIEKTVAHTCRHGMRSSDDRGSGREKKPTGFPTNPNSLRNKLSHKCLCATSRWSGEAPERAMSTRKAKPSNTQWNSQVACALGAA